MAELVQELFEFIRKSPTAGHTVAAAQALLEAGGFQKLLETDEWRLRPGGKYFATRGMTSIVAFQAPGEGFHGFSIVAPHGDSPCFKVKGSPEMDVEGQYTRLNTEVYGGTVAHLWLDRPLSVAGRLAVRTAEGVKTVLTDIGRDLLLIPSLAPHMDHWREEARKLDPQKETLPLFGGSKAKLLALAAEQAGVREEDVLSYELYLYNRAPGAVFGAGQEFICAPRLDDLECAFAAIKAILAAENPENCVVCSIFDNEEIGSKTRRGADSTLLRDVLSRVCLAYGKTEEEKLRLIAGSMMLSADNGHAVHPDYPEKADPTSRCYMNGGVVVKHSTRYATDAVSAGVFVKICQEAGVPVQEYYNHSAISGGGTLGNLSGAHVSIPTVDMGVAQLSMHSPYETAGREDLAHLVGAMTAFYNSRLRCQGDGVYAICAGGEPQAGNAGGEEEAQAEAAGPVQEEKAAVVEEARLEPAAAVETPEEDARAGESPEEPVPAGEAPQAVPAMAEEKEEVAGIIPRAIENKPGWQNQAVFYQIYPMGFCGAPFENDGKPASRILKVKDWVPHLQKLNVGAVYFSPVFESDTHGYDTRDYRKIDCRLGSNQDFKAVCDALHQAGIRVVLDGVFNHVGRGFWAFQDVLQKRESSPYKDWFHINFGGNSGYNDGLWYEGWEGHFELVKLNLQNPAVVDHLLGCVGQWMEEFQIDGLRLDVAYMVDQNFMRRLHSFCRERRPDFFLLGEMIHGDYRRIMNPEMLDSVTNYECYKGLYSSFNDKNMFEIAHSLNRQFGAEGWCLYRGEHLVCFADNHDVTRIHTILKEKEQLPALYAMLYCMPGIPCLYYGSEWGADGDKKDGDPALRPCFDGPVENGLTEFLGRLGRVKLESRALSDGTYKNETLLNKQIVIRRECPEETVLAAINADGAAFTIQCQYSGPATELLTGEKGTLNGAIDLPPYGVKLYRLG